MNARTLNSLKRGECARILAIAPGAVAGQMPQRLLEMGFAEGADVELLHVGPFGGDPICVRVGATQVALRRAEAELVSVAGAAARD